MKKYYFAKTQNLRIAAILEQELQDALAASASFQQIAVVGASLWTSRLCRLPAPAIDIHPPEVSMKVEETSVRKWSS